MEMTAGKMADDDKSVCQRRNPSWTPVLVIAHVLVLVLTLAANFLSVTVSSVKLEGIFLSSTGNISAKYPINVTPDEWTLFIWGITYVWQLIHVIYSLSLLCRKNKEGEHLYLQPGHIHFSFYIVYMFNNSFNIGFIFLYDREFLELAFLSMCLMAITLYICGAIVCRFLDESGNYLSSTGSKKEIWMTRVFVLNGLALYGMWVTMTSVLNFVGMLQHRANVDPDTCAWIFFAIVNVELVVWFVLETFVFDKYLRYCFSQYIGLPVAFAGILTENYNPSSPAPYYIYGIVLLAISVILGIGKVVVMFVKGRRNPILYHVNSV